MTQILNRFTGAVITSSEMELRELVLSYVKGRGCGADLCDANLRDADLCGANLSGANLSGANLRDADLSDANLCGANLRDADLSDANLCGANLRGANLCGANLRDADLSDANLRDADLCGANLSGANLCGADYKDIEINKCAVFTGLYLYIAMPIIDTEGKEWIRLGCYFRTVEDWAADFWNNPKEFPNNGDTPSKLRWMAYQTCLQWLEINREEKL